MEVIKSLSQYFLLSLGTGTFLFSFITPVNLTGIGFRKLLGYICYGSLLIFSIIALSKEAKLVSLIPVVLFITGMSFSTHEIKVNLWLKKLFVLAAYILIPINIYLFSEMNLLLFSYFALTTLFLGITNYAMVLGHYYLVVPKLSEWPLLKSLKFFWVFLILKIIVSIYGYFQAPDFFNEGSRLGAGYMFNWILLTMRFLWGYVALGILSIFAYKLCKIRSIQSATGVFYVMVFFILIGELISGYLYYNYGLFI